MVARIPVGVLGGLPLAACGAALVAVASGNAPNLIAAGLFALLGILIAAVTPDTGTAWRRLLVATGITLLGLALAAFTFGTAAQGLRAIPPVLLLLAGAAGAAIMLAGLYRPARVALLDPPPPAVFDSPDTTQILEMPAALVNPTSQHANHRKLLYAVIPAAVCALLLALWWRHPVDAPLPSVAMGTAPATAPAATTAADVPVDSVDVSPALSPAASPEESPASPRPAVTASAARRECMAQIESVHLFQKIAHQAAARADYDLAVDTEKKRLLAGKLIGPRTLGIIAAQVWSNRDRPDQATAWWTRQYQRCESQRATGASYVVRSN